MIIQTDVGLGHRHRHRVTRDDGRTLHRRYVGRHIDPHGTGLGSVRRKIILEEVDRLNDPLRPPRVDPDETHIVKDRGVAVTITRSIEVAPNSTHIQRPQCDLSLVCAFGK